MKTIQSSPFQFKKTIVLVFIISLFYCMPLLAQNAATAGTEVLTNSSIIQLKSAGLSASLILSKITGSRCNFTTDVNSLIQLKNANVDDSIIDAMIKKATAPAATTAAANPQGSSNFAPDKWGTTIGKETYISFKGDVYTVGQKLKIAKPIGRDGFFKDIISFDLLGSPAFDHHANQTWTNTVVEIAKIVVIKTDPQVVYLLFKETTVKKLGINIEAALADKEVSPM